MKNEFSHTVTTASSFWLFHPGYFKIDKSIMWHFQDRIRLSTDVPGGFSITGEAPLVLGEVAVPVTPSVEHPTTVMPPSKLSISAELLLVILPHKDALST